MRLERHLDELARAAMKSALNLEEDAPALLRPTQDARFGDFQINAAMALGKKLKKAPRELAQPIAEALAAQPGIAKTEVAGPGFINLTLDDAWLAAALTEALRDAERGAVPTVDAPEKIVVDFSSPNIAKQMHVGHLRSSIIGESICRMLRFVGHEVIGDNHLGDWGTQFALLIMGMREWGDEAALEANAIVELERVYKLASKRVKGDESEGIAPDEAFAAGARAELAKLQAGDPDNRALWEKFVATTRATLEVMYRRLDVHFDEWLGESAYNDMLPGVVEKLLEAGIAREDDGAICVFWNEQENPPKKLKKKKEPFIVRKRDGAFLYSTTDIATVLYRKEKFTADRALYVVDHRQEMHFAEFFAVSAMLGVEMRLEHIKFGTVLGTDGKPLKTRDGTTVTLASLLDAAEEKAREELLARKEAGSLRVEDADLDAVTRAIGIGAVKYADLQNNRTSDYRFDLDRMVSFEGNAGPYLQYTHARAASILRKGETDAAAVAASNAVAIGTPEEATLARVLARFADVVHKAAETSQPHLLAEYLYELCKAFSSFFTENPVLGAADEATKASRLALVALTKRTLGRGLGLLGLEAIERM